LGNGNGTFQAPAPYASDSFFVQTGDLNGDGIPDLIVPGGYLLGNGDGTFQPQVTFQADPTFSDSLFLQVTADFNRDGKLDIANAGLLSGSVAVFLNTSQAEHALSVVSAASLEPGPLAPGSLATIFGSNLAAAQGTSVSIQDSSGSARTASLLYVSPQQVNFVVPDGTVAGPATLSVTPAQGVAQSVPIEIAPVAPALFSIGSGGVAAGYVVIAAANGTQTVEPLFQLQGATPIAIPVSLGSASSQAYLVLYGTGLRGAQGAVAVTVQGQDATITYAGAQSQFAGLDQVNVLIPPALAGAGLAAVQVTAGDLTSNLVYLLIE
ncbi:MAG: IPT/TIG domain-containing protein, partial [Bryobacteraceae bacterium]